MPRIDPPRDHSRRRRPGIEALEARDLPATIPLPTIPRGANIMNLPAVQYALNTLYGPNQLPQFNDTQANGTIIYPEPSVFEVHREFLETKAIAPYTVTAPRFTNQEETVHAASNLASSNQFLVGRPQIIFFPSTDPNMPATGIIHIITSSFLQSGAALVLDLTEAAYLPDGQLDTTVTGNAEDGTTHGFNNATGEIVPNDHFERGPDGLPEQFTWILDTAGGTIYVGASGSTPNIAYATLSNSGQSTGNLPAVLPGPTGTGTGAGVLSIDYKPDRKPQEGTMGSGQMVITGSGLTNVAGMINTASVNFS